MRTSTAVCVHWFGQRINMMKSFKCPTKNNLNPKKKRLIEEIFCRIFWYPTQQ